MFSHLSFLSLQKKRTNFCMLCTQHVLILCKYILAGKGFARIIYYFREKFSLQFDIGFRSFSQIPAAVAWLSSFPSSADVT